MVEQFGRGPTLGAQAAPVGREIVLRGQCHRCGAGVELMPHCSEQYGQCVLVSPDTAVTTRTSYTVLSGHG